MHMTLSNLECNLSSKTSSWLGAVRKERGQHDMDISRRRFIKTTSGTLAIGVAAGSAALQVGAAAQQTSNLTSDQPEEQRRVDMVFRRLVRTAQCSSLVVLVAFHMQHQPITNQ